MIFENKIAQARLSGLHLVLLGTFALALAGCEPLDFGGGGEVGGGKLAFIRQGGLEVSLPGGGDEYTLTDQNTSTSPAFSPNGASIAFGYRDTEEDGYSLYRVGSSRNSRLEVIAEAPFGSSYHSPAWSPDGATIVFVAENPTDGLTLMQVPADGGSPVPVSGSSEMLQFPSFIDKNSLLVVHGNNSELKRFSIDTGTLASLNLNTNSRPAVSPDGRLIAFSTAQDGGHIIVSGLQGGQTTEIPSSGGGDVSPAFSPNGDVVAFESRGQILGYVIDSDDEDDDDEFHILQSGTQVTWGP